MGDPHPDGPGAPVKPAVPAPPLGSGSDSVVKSETRSEVAQIDRRGRVRINSHVRPPLVKESWIWLGEWYCQTKERLPPLVGVNIARMMDEKVELYSRFPPHGGGILVVL